MKKINILIQLFCVALLMACTDMLDKSPQGVISDDDLNSPEKVEQMIHAAYSFVGQNHFNKQFGLPYEEGSVRAGEAYKGGSGTADNEERHFWETFVFLSASNCSELDNLWWVHYVAVGRIHDAMRRAQELTDAEYPLKNQRIAELKFLRAHVYLYMKLCFKFFPYIDENTPEEDYDKVSNDDLTDQELWGKLIDDMRDAVEGLPNTQDQIGRPTKYAAKAYLAKLLLFAAYEQNDNHSVININREKLTEVAALCKEVIDGSGKRLVNDFAENFLWEYENGPESIWAIQYSANDDNSPVGRVNAWLIYPVNDEYGCCGFLQPSANMLNRFKTVNGVPDFDNYNTGTILNTRQAFASNPMDPRLMHTACVPEMPWKYDPDFVMQNGWVRTPEVYGYTMSQKMIVLPSCPCFRKTNPFMGSGLNYDVLRLDEVMLIRAEALIQLDGGENLAEALSLINAIRERAAKSTERLVFADGTPTGNFDVKPYIPGQNCPAWTQDFAMKALQWERNLEFCTEGKRFFDLVRWGIAAEEMNAYFTTEKNRRTHLSSATFVKGKDEYFPIPQTQISYVKGLYKQNPGW